MIKIFLMTCVLLASVAGVQGAGLDLELGIALDSGQIHVSGSSSTNLEYILFCSSNLTEWTIADELSSLTEETIHYVETNRADCLFYKRICSKVNGVSFIETGDASMPAMVTLADGSMIAAFVETNEPSRVTSAVYCTTNGDSLLMELGTNGIPRTMTSDGSVFYFRDWTETTVDVWWIHSNGTRQVFEDVLFKGEAEASILLAQSMPIAMAAGDDGEEVASDLQEILDIVFIGLDIGGCAVSVATFGVTGGATIPAAALTCSAAAAGIVELIFDEPWAGGAGAVLSFASDLLKPEHILLEGILSAISIGNASFGILLSTRENAEGVITEIEASYCILPPDGMVLISDGINNGTNPLGIGYFGDPEHYTSSYPESYSLEVDAFFMDQAEVSNDQMVEVLQWAYDNEKLIVTASTVKNLNGNQQELLNLDAPGCRIVWDAQASTFAMKATNGSGYPCVHITFYGAMAYCNYLSEIEERTPCYDLNDWSCNLDATGFRIPSNDEWEYAARGGLIGKRYPWGNTISHSIANYTSDGNPPPPEYDLSTPESGAPAGEHPSYSSGDWPHSCPVNSFETNAYGLYCMAGNVREYAFDYPLSTLNDIACRGGDWMYSAQDARCGERWNISGSIDFQDPIIGFRAVCK